MPDADAMTLLLIFSVKADSERREAETIFSLVKFSSAAGDWPYIPKYIPKYQGDKLQRVQNTAARMITGARSSNHITPLLKSLHWLPVEARIHFKILLITYKILNGQSAGYLEPLIKDYHPSRALRSPSRSLLCTPAIKSKTYGGRAFSTAAPQLWNTTPEYIKNVDSVTTLKTKVKTFLFRKCFN